MDGDQRQRAFERDRADARALRVLRPASYKLLAEPARLKPLPAYKPRPRQASLPRFDELAKPEGPGP